MKRRGKGSTGAGQCLKIGGKRDEKGQRKENGKRHEGKAER